MGKKRQVSKRKAVVEPKRYQGPYFGTPLVGIQLSGGDTLIVDVDNVPWLITAYGELTRPAVRK